MSDEDYKATFAAEYPSDRPEARSDYVPPSNDGNKQVVFESSEEEEDD